MASGGYRPALGVDQYLATEVAKDGIPGQGGSGEITVGRDFPIVCETCLGPNPYVRMIKVRFGEKLCKISNAPMQSFRWKAGPEGRFKETIVCREVAVEKNICQACLTDMTFGVPVGVRDALLRAGGSDERVGGYVEARSNANQAHYYAQQRRALEDGTAAGSVALLQEEPSRELLSLARSIEASNAKRGTAFRNLPKICSFWLAGTCTRVGKGKARGTCPFRPCCCTFKFPELAANHPVECAALVEDLRANGVAAAMASTPTETRQLIKDAISGNKDDAIRARVSGKDATTARYVARAKASRRALEPPADGTATTLWVGGLDEGCGIAEADLVDAFYHFGELRGIRIHGNSAFVEFADRAGAEAAAANKFRNLHVKGKDLSLDWAKPRAAANDFVGAEGGGGQRRAPPPPGTDYGERAPALRPELAGLVADWPLAPPPPPGGHVPPPLPYDAAGGPPAKRARMYPSQDPTRLGSRPNEGAPPGPPPRAP